MSVPMLIPSSAGLGRSHLRAVLAAIMLVMAIATSATYAVASGTRSLRSRPPTLASVLRTLTPSQRRYVHRITSLTSLQLWAAFGTSLTPPTTTSPTVALPILPACGPGFCWRATTIAAAHEGRSAR